MKTKIEPKITSLKCITPDQKWLSLWKLQWENGEKKGSWTFASRKSDPSHSKGADAVVIVATVWHDGEWKLVITKEYRYPIGGYEYGFPAGLIDKGETVSGTAIRELKEETGLDVKSIDLTSGPIYSSAGMTDESVAMVFATAKGELSKKHLEASEDIETMLLSGKQVRKLLMNEGKYADAKVSGKAWGLMLAFGTKNHWRKSNPWS